MFCGPRESFLQSTDDSVGMGNEVEGMQLVWVRSVMSLYERAWTRVRVDFVLSDELDVSVWMHQGLLLSHFIFAVVVDVFTKFTREGALS